MKQVELGRNEDRNAVIITTQKISHEAHVKGDVAVTTEAITLSNDMKREIINRLITSPALLTLAAMDNSWMELCATEVSRSLRSRLVIDVEYFFRDRNPFLRRFVTDKAYRKSNECVSLSFSDDLRQSTEMLWRYCTYIEDLPKGEIDHLELENFSPKSLGWMGLFSEKQPTMYPVELENNVLLILILFEGTIKYTYFKTFMVPVVFIGILHFRADQITSLDLGDLHPHHNLEVLRNGFPNLEELMWHRGIFEVLRNVHFPKLSVLSLTTLASSRGGYEVITQFPSLNRLFTGLVLPDNWTWFDKDVQLQKYQQFWNLPVSFEDRVELEDFHENGLFINTLRRLSHIGFWNAPEKLFIIMAKLDLRFETLQFGQLNQSLMRLCFFESVLQALFKFNQPQYDCYELHVSHLKMYLRATPHAPLNYYLPHLMIGVNDFDDLDCHLPASLLSVSISISLSSIDASKSVASLLDFMKRLADVNAFPDLEELHLQVWGIRCAENLLNRVAYRLSNLRHLSVIAMPVVEQRSSIIDVIRHVSSSCHRLVSLKFSTQMMKLLLDEYGDLWRKNWRLAITLLSKECHLRDTCELSVDHLPHTSGWDDYFLIPHYPQNPFIDDETSESLNRMESEDVSDAEPEAGDSIFSSDQ